MTIFEAPRAGIFRRAVATALTGLHLVLVLGAGGHAGDHAPVGLAELPIEYHDHAFQWSDAADEGPRIHPECVACHLQRTGLDRPAPASIMAIRPSVVDALPTRGDRHLDASPSHPEPIRGPPPVPFV